MFQNPAYYQAKIPAVGTYLKKEDRLSLHDECEEGENITLMDLLEPPTEASGETK